MYTLLHEVRRQPQWAESRRQTLTPAKIKSTQHLLRSLHDAIARRNVETAIELIRLHVASTQEDMIYKIVIVGLSQQRLRMLPLVPHQVERAHVFNKGGAVFRPPVGDRTKFLNARLAIDDGDDRPIADKGVIDAEQIFPHHLASPKA